MTEGRLEGIGAKLEGTGRGTGRLSEERVDGGAIAADDADDADDADEGDEGDEGDADEETEALGAFDRSESGMTNRAAAAVPPSGNRTSPPKLLAETCQVGLFATTVSVSLTLDSGAWASSSWLMP